MTSDHNYAISVLDVTAHGLGVICKGNGVYRVVLLIKRVYLGF